MSNRGTILASHIVDPGPSAGPNPLIPGKQVSATDLSRPLPVPRSIFDDWGDRRWREDFELLSRDERAHYERVARMSAEDIFKVLMGN